MNRLQNQQSPYLLQHAENPVDWYPWCDEAFKKAKAENKPVFLSIGYATCHWCHVMAHESFEDEQVAELMNNAFVNIKVDREERPDIDNTYMTICQMLTGRGGWPLTIIMTPEKEPFFAATYIPKQSRQRMQGMVDLIPQIHKIWTDDKKRVMDSVKKIKNGFSKSLQLGQSKGDLSADVTTQALRLLEGQFDQTHGGFGSQPKFPSPHNLLFLLRYADYHQHENALKMVETTLTQMRLGGIWDHIGGGFHRYSTNAEWLLPHFEKMLYDQAMLLLAYAEGWRLTSDPLYKQTCYEIFSYLDRKMKSPEGAYYSAEDADSDGEEGKFYVWEKETIFDLLPESDAGLFCDIYNINNNGNYRDEATGRYTGRNIPHLNEPVDTIADKRQADAGELAQSLKRIRNSLKNAREKRVHPLLDDKILTDWNGLLMAAFATAGTIFQDDAFTDAAKEIEEFLYDRMISADHTMLHRYRREDAAIDGMADDYSACIWGLIELHQTTLNPEYLEKAVSLQKSFNEQFWDDDHGGYYFTSQSGEELLGRQKEMYDGALPSSNSIAALNGFRLSRLTGDMTFDDQSDQIFSVFSELIEYNPSGYTFALIPLLVKEHHPAEIAVTGPAESSQVEQFLNYFHTADRFRYSVLLKTDQNADRVEKSSEFLKPFNIGEKAAVYVCRNFSCDAPVQSVEELKKLLKR
ncbi:MAG: DUF255 domain-containing protein [Bacteroidetes bacterium]|jgi:uncharacterized protein YyaL (SSP411 family)|nr:DUF255 domain-containing protein [Bacteroidota bacterium]